MQGVLIPLLPEQRAALAGIGILSSTFKMNGTDHTLIEEKEVETACRVLDLGIGARTPTKFAGIELLTLRRREQEQVLVRCANREVFNSYLRQMKIKLSALRDDVAVKRRMVAELQTRLTEAASALRLAEDELEALVQAETKRAEEQAREYETLITENRDLEAVDFAEDCITFVTRTICFTDPRSGVQHEVGKLRVEIRLKAAEKHPVIIKNLTRTIRTEHGEYGHPHVPTHGVPCLGPELKTLLPSLLGEARYVELIILLLEYLKQVTVNDNWGEHCHLWPKAA